MFKQICLILSSSLYDVKRTWTREFAKALNRKGFVTSLVDVGEGPLEKAHLDQVMDLRPELTLSFSPLLPIEGDVLLCDLIKVPHLTLLSDPAIYSLYLAKSPYSLVGCVDYFDCELFFNAKIEDRVFFFPHAISGEQILEPPAEKIYDAVFIGSSYDAEAVRESWHKNYPPEVVTIIERAIAITLSDDHTAFTQAFVEAWRDSELDPTGQDFEGLCRQVDMYIRAVGRLELLKAITDVDVHVFGGKDEMESGPHRDWNDLLGSQRNIKVHPAISRDEAWQVIRQSKVCLNSSPWFKHGTHERIILGLAGRSLVFSDANRFIEAHFGEARGVVPYVLGGWDHLNERLHYYLERDEERNAVVEMGMKTVGLEHTWDVRAEEFSQRIPPIWNRIASENFIRTF